MKQMWERAKEKVEKAERMKESVTRHVDYTCMDMLIIHAWRNLNGL